MTATAPESSTAVRPRFPEGFHWVWPPPRTRSRGPGTRTARGPSIWDTYAHTPGNIKNDENGDVANDHYHRYQEDVALMRDIGATAYRFSVAWPRIFPEGTVQPNPKGLDFYRRLAWELYDGSNDWTQARDLSKEQPDKLAELQGCSCWRPADSTCSPWTTAASSGPPPRSPDGQH